jgi:hypothetical protein
VRAVTEDLRKDVEVMRRVLVREGLAAPGTATSVNSVDGNRLLWVALDGTAPGRSSSEAYVVPGDGVTFVLRTSDPVAPGRGAAAASDLSKEPSAWDEAVAEVEGHTPLRLFKHRGMVAGERYDEAKVEALRARLVEQLAKFGGRLRGLGSGDHLTVIVTGSSGPGFTALADAKAAQGTYHVLSGGSEQPTVLTVRVTVEDCRAFAAGTLSLEQFRGRAVLSAY